MHLIFQDTSDDFFYRIIVFLNFKLFQTSQSRMQPRKAAGNYWIFISIPSSLSRSYSTSPPCSRTHIWIGKQYLTLFVSTQHFMSERRIISNFAENILNHSFASAMNYSCHSENYRYLWKQFLLLLDYRLLPEPCHFSVCFLNFIGTYILIWRWLAL